MLYLAVDATFLLFDIIPRGGANGAIAVYRTVGDHPIASAVPCVFKYHSQLGFDSPAAVDTRFQFVVRLSKRDPEDQLRIFSDYLDWHLGSLLYKASRYNLGANVGFDFGDFF
jgi:hypothetical protein